MMVVVEVMQAWRHVMILGYLMEVVLLTARLLGPSWQLAGQTWEQIQQLRPSYMRSFNDCV